MEDYRANWHHRLYSEYLDKFASGEIKRLMVFMPPQHGKSQLCSRHLPAKMLGNDPDLRIAIVAYNHTFASKFNRDIQRIIDSSEYGELFPETRLNSKNIRSDASGSWLRNSDEFEIVGKRGSLISVGVGGGLTGNKVDVAIVDDPYKDAMQAYSAVYRNNLLEWWFSVLDTRLHNDSRICLTFTRWHEDDIASRLLEMESVHPWVVVRFQALKEPGETVSGDPREVGDALWPGQRSAESLQAIKQNNPSVFEAMYQQNPTPAEGNMVQRDWFRVAPIHAVPLEVRQGVKDFVGDTAYTEKSINDPSGFLAYIEHGGFLYLFDYLSLRKEFPELKKQLKMFVSIVGAKNSRVYIEPKASGKSIVQDLKGELNVIEYKLPKGDKISRLAAVMPYLESGRVIMIEGAWNDAFITEVIQFPKGKHDEAIDCLTMAIMQGLVRGKDQYTGKADYA